MELRNRGAFYYPRSSLRFILRVADRIPEFCEFSGVGTTADALSVVAFEPSVYSIEWELYSYHSAVLFRRSA